MRVSVLPTRSSKLTFVNVKHGNHTISDLAREFDLPPRHAFYEDMGLLRPRARGAVVTALFVDRTRLKLTLQGPKRAWGFR